MKFHPIVKDILYFLNVQFKGYFSALQHFNYFR